MTTTHFGCVGNTFPLRSGKYFDLRDPQPDQFEFSDIASALAKTCRFGGHTNRFYSVAEHCWHAAWLANESSAGIETERAALLHDAAEAFVGDVIKPLKIMLENYSEIEDRILEVIGAKFGVVFSRHADILTKIDRSLLIAERDALYDFPRSVPWPGEELIPKRVVESIKQRIQCYPPEAAELCFTARAMDLGIIPSAE